MLFAFFLYLFVQRVIAEQHVLVKIRICNSAESETYMHIMFHVGLLPIPQSGEFPAPQVLFVEYPRKMEDILQHMTTDDIQR